MRKDLRRFGIEEDSWYKTAQEGDLWRGKCKEGLAEVTRVRVREDETRRKRNEAINTGQLARAATLPFKCDTCQRTFRRRQDITRHKCSTTRSKGRTLGSLV